MLKSDDTKFRWAVDSKGYALSKDGRKIVRKGGRMDYYSPDDLDPSPHYFLGNLRGQILELGEIFEPETKDRFWRKRFETFGDAVLSFVSKFGMLGVGTNGVDSKSESIADIEKQQWRLSLFMDFGADPGKTPVESFNRWVIQNYSVRLGLKGKRAEFYIIPNSFMDWAWLRAGLDLVNGTQWRSCGHCHRPIAVGKPTKVRSALILGAGFLRSGAEFCSDSCRVMSARKRLLNKRKR